MDGIIEKKTNGLGKSGNTWEPSVMSAEEAFYFMDSAGIRYEQCNTPVPVTLNKISCGKPMDIGDMMIDEYHDLPRSALKLHPVTDVPAIGDSMIEAGICEDDWLRLELGAIPSDGDIVMAAINGEFLAKVFFTDSQNRYWLLPKNKNYRPILLTPDSDIRISGVVHHITKKLPRQSYNECMAILNRDQKKKDLEADVMQRLEKAACEGCHLFWAASAWAVAYGVVRDCFGYEGSVSDFERKAENFILTSNFAYPCAVGKVQRTISNHPYMRLHVDKWKEKSASTREIVLMEFLKRNL